MEKSLREQHAEEAIEKIFQFRHTLMELSSFLIGQIILDRPDAMTHYGHAILRVKVLDDSLVMLESWVRERGRRPSSP